MKEFGEDNKRVIGICKEHTIGALSVVSRDILSQCGYLSKSVRKVVWNSAIVDIFLEIYENLTRCYGGHSSHTTTSIVRLNTIWALSLVLSPTSILLAILILLMILIQQWACKFIQLPLFPGLLSERARVRMHHAVETAPLASLCSYFSSTT